MTTATNIIDTAKEFLDRGYSHDFRIDDGALHDVTPFGPAEIPDND